MNDIGSADPLDVEVLRAYVRARPGELEWTATEWLADLWEARAQAVAERKPLLVWAMNGHPLGCT